jgi:hypothetical protein
MRTEEQIKAEIAALQAELEAAKAAKVSPVRHIPEEAALFQLDLLYNYRRDDSPQFTRWQMITAMSHGYVMAVNKALGAPEPTEAEDLAMAREICHICEASSRENLALAAMLAERARAKGGSNG